MSRLSELWHHITDQKTATTDLFDEFAKLLHGSAKPLQPPPVVPVQPPPDKPAPEPNKPGTKDGSLIWIAKAKSFIGTLEVPGSGDNPVILKWAKEDGGSIGENYTHDSIPWCALFVWTMMRMAGLKWLNTLWALDGLKYGIGLDGPAVGAIVCFQREGGGHIAFVVGKDQHGNMMCLGGNQSDAVNIKPFDPGRAKGFRWPSEVARPARTGMASLPVVNSDGKVSRNEA